MPVVTVDGVKVEIEEGMYVLDAIKKAGISVPALCHHPALPPFGACRLCIVDIWKPSWDPDWFRLVASCLYPVEEGLVVFTNTKRVIEARKVVLDLLLARCPNTPLVKGLAKEYGLEKTTYDESPEPTDCILCGLCVRICDHLGMSAISTVFAGFRKQISPPLDKEPPEACIGCLSCAHICPTEYIKFEENGDKRKIWGKEFEMMKCKRCGKAFVTVEQVEWEVKKGKVPREFFELCDACKREEMKDKVLSLQVRV